jgi:hypothetical protein
VEVTLDVYLACVLRKTTLIVITDYSRNLRNSPKHNTIPCSQAEGQDSDAQSLRKSCSLHPTVPPSSGSKFSEKM